MSRFIESIRFEDGQFHLLDLHQERIDRTFAAFFPRVKPIQIADLLPEFSASGKHKFRCVYDHHGCAIEHAPYSPKTIRSVQIIESNTLDYSYKFSDRTELTDLLKSAATDEIIIVKNGLVTDCSYANIACFDGANWWTPRLPLLAGVRRADLLAKNVIKEKDIRSDELSNYKICLINAMLDLEEVEISIA